MRQLNSERTNYPVSESERANTQARSERTMSSFGRRGLNLRYRSLPESIRENIQAKTKEDMSLDKLVDLYYDKIRDFMIKMLAKRRRANVETDAEDLTQEVFYQTCRDFGSLRGYPKGWLYRIAEHVLFNFFRRSEKNNRRMVPLPDPEEKHKEFPYKGLSSDHQLFLREMSGKLLKAILLLPPRQRDAMIQHHIQFIDYTTVGRNFGCSRAGARRSVVRGLHSLRQSLKWESE